MMFTSQNVYMISFLAFIFFKGSYPQKNGTKHRVKFTFSFGTLRRTGNLIRPNAPDAPVGVTPPIGRRLVQEEKLRHLRCRAGFDRVQPPWMAGLELRPEGMVIPLSRL